MLFGNRSVWNHINNVFPHHLKCWYSKPWKFCPFSQFPGLLSAFATDLPRPRPYQMLHNSTDMRPACWMFFFNAVKYTGLVLRHFSTMYQNAFGTLVKMDCSFLDLWGWFYLYLFVQKPFLIFKKSRFQSACLWSARWAQKTIQQFFFLCKWNGYAIRMYSAGILLLPTKGNNCISLFLYCTTAPRILVSFIKTDNNQNGDGYNS